MKINQGENMKIKNFRLTDNSDLTSEPTDKHGKKFNPGLPDTIIIHYTATRNLKAAVHTLAKSDKKASAHLVIGRDGKIVQLVDFDTISWHAGESEYKGRKGFNQFAIGIEIDNPGWLNKTGNKFTTWYEAGVDIDDVVEARHRNPETTKKYWHRYTEKQVAVVEDICELLVKEYNMKFILGHEEVSPGRKQDPGPAFPLDKLRANILNSDRDQLDGPEETFPADGVVKVNTSLNIRSQPSSAAKKVAKPLSNNQRVTIINEQDGWYQVQTEIKGWVSKEFIRKQA
jgi:N-acetylmuramoyl-L-alanine amidase